MFDLNGDFWGIYGFYGLAGVVDTGPDCVWSGVTVGRALCVSLGGSPWAPTVGTLWGRSGDSP